MMSRSTAIWFAIAGLSAMGRWVIAFADTQYYDPSSILDYTAVISQSAAGVATGIALLLLLRNPPVRRGAFLVAIAAVGAIAHGLGNLLEDAFDVAAGEWGFVLGGISMILALLAAGVAALSVNSPLRWSGSFLLVGATGGLLGHGLLAMGLAWIAFGIWITRQLNNIDTVIDQPLRELQGRR